MTTTEDPTDTPAHAANRAATFCPAVCPDPACVADNPGYPSITVAGAQVFAYVHPETGALRVSVHLDEAGEPLVSDTLDITSVESVPVEVVVSQTGELLWSSDRAGVERFHALGTPAERVRVARRAVLEAEWLGISPVLGRPLGRLMEALEDLDQAIGTGR